MNEKISFTCLVKASEKKCPYGPFKYRFHLNDHMRKTHPMVFLKIKPGLKKEIKNHKHSECNSYELQGDEKFIEESKKTNLEDFESMGDKSNCYMGKIGGKK